MSAASAPRLPPPLQDPRHHPNHGRTASYSATHKYAHQLNKGELGEEHAQGGATGRSGHVNGLPIRDLPNSATASVRGESPRDREKAPRPRAEEKAHVRVGPGSSDSRKAHSPHVVHRPLDSSPLIVAIEAYTAVDTVEELVPPRLVPNLTVLLLYNGMGQSTKASGSAIARYRRRQRPPPRRMEQGLLSHRSTPGSSSPDPRGHKVLRPRSQPRTRTSQRNCTERRTLSLDWHRVAAAASPRGKSATTTTRTTTDEDSSSIAPCATNRSPALSKPVWTRRDHWKPPPPPSRTSKNCG